jgi:hypothetical protein
MHSIKWLLSPHFQLASLGHPTKPKQHDISVDNSRHSSLLDQINVLEVGA